MKKLSEIDFFSKNSIAALAILLAMMLLCFLVQIVRGQTAPTPAALTELERTKLLLVKEQERNNITRGQMIYQAHEQNLKDQQTLEAQEKELTESICTAHGLKSANCGISPDGKQVQFKPDAPKAATGAKPVAK